MAKSKDSNKKKEQSKNSDNSNITKVVTPKNSKVKVKVIKGKKKKQTAQNIQVVSGFERYKMVEVAAYYLAEKNAFAGSAAEYWVEAEKIIDTKVTVDDTPKATKPAKSSKKKESLTIVEGIGPKIESLLIADGIITLSDLASADIEALGAILKKAGPRYQMHKPDTWPQQAALARDGEFEALDTLQEQLKGGRA